MKLRGFFVAKKNLISGVCVVGETRISNCATDEGKFSKQNSLWTSQR